MNSLLKDFVLRIDKPEGPTSHDVVRAARNALGVRRVGHTGTLDPFASGLLLVCVGQATRLAEYLSVLDKTYEAVAQVGCATDTLDCRGLVVYENDAWVDLDTASIECALGKFHGEIEQVPPMYSAKKVRGERAYQRARRGEHIELAPAAVTVHELELTEVALPRVRFRLRCSSGTYVRALARDLGVALGVGAHLKALRRTAIGGFHVEDAIPVDDLLDRTEVSAGLMGPLEALPHLPTLDVDEETAARLVHGQSVQLIEPVLQGTIAVAHEGGLLAIGEFCDGTLHPRKVFKA